MGTGKQSRVANLQNHTDDSRSAAKRKAHVIIGCVVKESTIEPFSTVYDV